MPSLPFSESGQGFPIVFIHGFCETREIWKEFTEPLANHFHVYTLDLPGFGGADLLPFSFSIDDEFHPGGRGPREFCYCRVLSVE